MVLIARKFLWKFSICRLKLCVKQYYSKIIDANRSMKNVRRTKPLILIFYLAKFCLVF